MGFIIDPHSVVRGLNSREFHASPDDRAKTNESASLILHRVNDTLTAPPHRRLCMCVCMCMLSILPLTYISIKYSERVYNSFGESITRKRTLERTRARGWVNALCKCFTSCLFRALYRESSARSVRVNRRIPSRNRICVLELVLRTSLSSSISICRDFRIFRRQFGELTFSFTLLCKKILLLVNRRRNVDSRSTISSKILRAKF